MFTSITDLLLIQNVNMAIKKKLQNQCDRETEVMLSTSTFTCVAICVCVCVFVEQSYSKLIISQPNLYRAGMLDYMQTSNATNTANATATAVQQTKTAIFIDLLIRLNIPCNFQHFQQFFLCSVIIYKDFDSAAVLSSSHVILQPLLCVNVSLAYIIFSSVIIVSEISPNSFTFY